MADSAFALPTGASATRAGLGLATTDTPEFAGIISGANGFDISPLSDIDADLLTVNVSGTPKFFWDESQDKFSSTKGWEYSATINPVANDGAALGTSTLQWSDLFLAEGGVINWDNGDATLTQVGNALTFAGAGIVLAAGDTTYAPIKFDVGGSLMTTPDDGILEMDGNALYGCTDAGNRGVIPIEYLIRQDATYTLTSQTAAQKLFNASTNGTLTLETGTYLFEGLVALTAMSATSGNLTFSLAGTATLGSILWFGYGRDAAADAATGTLAGSYSVDATLVAAPLFTAGTGTTAFAHIKGTFEITAGGTIIPSIALQTAAAAVVSIGSYFKCNRIGSTSLTTIGEWS